jgi:DNA helicase-2/ATP-dependent DNA helicase PcrA
MSKITANLNEPQKRAVETVTGPVLVLAGPGSGKTRVLTRRIAYMIDEKGIAPWNIAAVTFTNKAAGEMRERVALILQELSGAPPLAGQPARLGGLTIGTFHSICARILRVETVAAGFQPNWIIYDSADQVALVRAVMRDLNLDEKRYPPKAIHAHISNRKNDLITPEEFRSSSYFEEIAGRVYRSYQESLLANNAMDFDDLLLRTVLLLRDNLDVRIKYQRKWPYLLVDEFQDTNTAQYEMLRLLVNEPTIATCSFSVRIIPTTSRFCSNRITAARRRSSTSPTR